MPRLPTVARRYDAAAMAPSTRTQNAVFVAIALLGVLPALSSPGSTVGDGVDAFGTHWFYWWIRQCIEHFGDPSHTNLFFYPAGKDIFAHTGNNFVDAVFSVPLQWIFGGTLYSPVWIAILQIGNALTFRPLARYVLGAGGKDTFAAFAATVLWQVNPFVLFEITAGRPTQAMVWFLPGAVLYLLRSAREPGLANPVWFGLAMAMSAWTYWYNVYFLMLLLLPLAAWELAGATDRLGVVRRWSVAVVVCIALVAPGLVGMIGAVNDGRVPGIDPTEGSIFTPPAGIANNVSADLHGLWLMEMYGAPLFFQPAWGLPVLILPFLRRLPVPGGRWRWLAGLGLVFLFAGGTMLRFGERAVVMPHYMALYHYLPFFDRLWFPYRMAIVGFIPAALLIGAMTTLVSRPKLLLGVLLGLGLAGQFAVGVWPFNYRHTKAPPMVASLRDLGGGVIFLPMRIQHDGLMWQTEFELPTYGGMGESAAIFWPDSFRKRMNNSFMKALRAATMTPDQPKPALKKDRAQVEREGFRWVILRRSLVESELRRQLQLTPDAFTPEGRLEETIAALTVAIGAGPSGVDGDSVLWDLRGKFEPTADWAPTPENLADSAWEEFGQPVNQERLERFGRTGRAPGPVKPEPPK